MKYINAFLIIISLGLFACEDILEEDVSDKNVLLIAPANGIETDLQNIGFLWEKIENVNSYRLQIATPNFDQAVSVLLDSLVEGNSFRFSLIPGKYQWRVRAENSAYESEYSTNSFQIDSLVNPINQIIALVEPEDSSYFQSEAIIFTWIDLVGTVQYNFQITQLNSIVLDTSIFLNEFEYQPLEEGVFDWQVKAFNNLGESNFSKRSIIIDDTPPSPPQNMLPLNGGFILSDSVDFSWTSENNIAFDSLFLKNAITGNDINGFPRKTEGEFLSIPLSTGEFEWYLKSVDKAMNTGTKSQSNTFNVLN
ncbi:MAG: hypothetical protein RH860_01815 [Cytophagales bacterium]